MPERELMNTSSRKNLNNTSLTVPSPHSTQPGPEIKKRRFTSRTRSRPTLMKSLISSTTRRDSSTSVDLPEKSQQLPRRPSLRSFPPRLESQEKKLISSSLKCKSMESGTLMSGDLDSIELVSQ